MKLFCTLLACLILAACPLMQSQSLTTVTITLTDGQGQVWANASYTATIQPPFGNPNPLQNNGFPIQVPIISGFADGTGTFVVNLDTNTTVSPAGSTYKLSICPNASVSFCSSSTITTTGATQNLSAAVSANLNNISVQALPNVSRAYIDAQNLNPAQGSLYWRVTDNHLRGFNGSTWVDIAGGGVTSSAWSALLAPTGNTTIGMGNFTTQFSYGAATGSGNPMLDLFDSTNNTGTNYLFRVRTAAGSTARPLVICVQGTSICIDITSTGILEALGTAQIIASSVVSNQSGIGEFFLGSNGSAVVSGANQIACGGNSNKFYCSENTASLAKVLMGGQLNAGTNKAIQSIDVNGVETDVVVPKGFTQIAYGSSAATTIVSGGITLVNVPLNGTFPNTNYIPICSATISASTPTGLVLQTAVPSTTSAVSVQIGNNSGFSVLNEIINCVAVE